jgi:molybdopterin molybdotransferase
MTEIEELWRLIDERVHPLGSETISLEKADGRVSSQSIPAGMDVPAFDQSAMDGYGVVSLGPRQALVTKQIAAGDLPSGKAVRPDQAVRIFTGAPIPEGIAAVIRQEDCVEQEGVITLREGFIPRAGDHIRRKASVLKAGQELFPPGSRIPAGAIGLLASCGLTEVEVYRVPGIHHIITGSELVEAGSEIRAGCVVDSNGPMIAALLRAEGLQTSRRRLPDDRMQIEKEAASFTGDLLMLSGGSGPGDFDHTASVLENSGFAIHTRRLNSRPGRPLLFATRGKAAAFGLPGNPLSHWVCYHAFVRRAIARMTGGGPQTPLEVQPVEGIPRAEDGRRTWTPMRVEATGDGLELRPLPWIHSGDLTPLAIANGLLLDGRWLLPCAGQSFDFTGK